MPEEIKKEPEDIFAEPGMKEESLRTTEPATPTIPREFIREKKSFPKILILIIILVILIGFGYFLYSQGVVKLERKEVPLVNQPIITPPSLPQPPPQILDTDGDGLTNQEEISLGTNPNLVDTDNDGLTDKEEVKIYQTEPLNFDTDGDGYKDGQEVLNGYNPKDPTSGAKLLDLMKEIEKLKE